MFRHAAARLTTPSDASSTPRSLRRRFDRRWDWHPWTTPEHSCCPGSWWLPTNGGQSGIDRSGRSSLGSLMGRSSAAANADRRTRGDDQRCQRNCHPAPSFVPDTAPRDRRRQTLRLFEIQAAGILRASTASISLGAPASRGVPRDRAGVPVPQPKPFPKCHLAFTSDEAPPPGTT